MKTAKSDRAAMHLRITSSSVECYGEGDALGVLLGELCGAVLYGEGDIDDMVAKVKAEIKKQTEEADSTEGAGHESGY